jgi:diaminopimelate decarboxylase
MLGTVIRRNWPIWKVSGTGEEPTAEYELVGPLCTSIDVLATRIRLPELHRGDVIAIGSSGAYGLTASPTRFISHPEPREYLVVGCGDDAEVVDVTEFSA